MKKLFLALLLAPAFAFAQDSTAIKPKFNHKSVCVKDLLASTHFYSEVMLLEKKPDPFKNGVFQWFVVGAGTELHLIKGDCNGTRFYNDHMAFSVASLTGFMKHLDELKVKYASNSGEGKMQTRPDGVHQIYLQDPDGNTIEVNDAK